ncbi:PT domain-containing protein [Thioalkalivibrio sp. AKL6]|uniref:PT domain-containing protein n=1 Tax=Thioalkalivibrio sp. AKL6 TaxID=1158154 RepID=UPI0035100DE2
MRNDRPPARGLSGRLRVHPSALASEPCRLRSQPANQPTSQPANQPTSQPANQPTEMLPLGVVIREADYGRW